MFQFIYIYIPEISKQILFHIITMQNTHYIIDILNEGYFEIDGTKFLKILAYQEMYLLGRSTFTADLYFNLISRSEDLLSDRFIS